MMDLVKMKKSLTLLIMCLTWKVILAQENHVNCVFGGGSCTDSETETFALNLTLRTFIMLIITFFVFVFFTVILLCCFLPRCPLFGDCEKTRGSRKPR
jgi:hypothetical protein